MLIFSEYGEDGSGDSSDSSDSSVDEDEERSGKQRKRRRKIKGDSGLFDNDFFESEFRKRRKVRVRVLYSYTFTASVEKCSQFFQVCNIMCKQNCALVWLQFYSHIVTNSWCCTYWDNRDSVPLNKDLTLLTSQCEIKWVEMKY